MNFCTSIHCIDGRIQKPLQKFLKEKYNTGYVDTITEPGPCKILAQNNNKTLINSILEKVKISVTKHGSKLIAISGHYDCAGNPQDEQTQKDQIKKSINYLESIYPDIKVIGLWIDDKWTVNNV